MTRFSLASLIGALLLVLAPLEKAPAANILYHVDVVPGTDRMAEALAGLSGTHSVTTAASIEDFTAKLASGNFELGIFFHQSTDIGTVYENAFAALESHVAGGGAAIITTNFWAQNEDYVSRFGVSYGISVNQSEITVTDPLLSAGIAGPIALENPGHWQPFFNVGLAGPYSAAYYGPGLPTEAAIIGTAPRTFVNGFLSDTFVDGAQGVQLYTNQINAVLADAVIPEPASVVLFGLGGLGLAGHCWLCRRRAGVGGRV